MKKRMRRTFRPKRIIPRMDTVRMMIRGTSSECCALLSGTTATGKGEIQLYSPVYKTAIMVFINQSGVQLT
jgi:hypothetical protein